MLVEFSVGNFRSIKDIQTIHFQAAKIKSKYKEVDEQNVFDAPKGYQLLKSKVIYGANASGKSNFFKALGAMLNIITKSFKDEIIIQNLVEPFFLSKETKENPTFFQIIFFLNDTLYRYGFQVFNGKVVDEWLFGTPNKREVYYFVREGMTIEVNENRFKEALEIISFEKPLYNKTSLFLTVAAASNRTLAKEIISFFSENIAISLGLNDEMLNQLAVNSLDDLSFKKQIQELLEDADMGIRKIDKTELNKEQIPLNIQKRLKGIRDEEKFTLVQVYKSVFDEKGKIVGTEKLNFFDDEAEGTKKLFSLSPIIFAALQKGKTIFIDEFDARLHPRLTRKIIEIFQSKITNPHNAQLVVIIHDTSLMDAKLLRRDQISFMEKDKYGASKFYSLVQYKGIRNDASFEKNYLNGSYGAVPFLNRMEGVFYQEEI